MSCKPVLELMDAYVDGEIDLVRSLEIEQHLKACPMCARAFDHRRSLVQTLASVPLSYSAPRDLKQKVRAAIIHSADDPRPDRPVRVNWSWRSWWSGAASAAVAALILFTALPKIQLLSADERLEQDVIAAHVRSLMTDHLTEITHSNQHVVKPWFNGRLDFSPSVQDLSDHGFPLAGGRVDSLAGHAVAALVYHRAAHPINLFTWPAAKGARLSMKTMTRRGYHLTRWSDGDMTYWAISDLNAHELNDFAELIRKK